MTGYAEVPMLEVSSDSLKAMTDLQLDQVLEQYLGITPRSFWTRSKKIQMLLNAASQVVDED